MCLITKNDISYWHNNTEDRICKDVDTTVSQRLYMSRWCLVETLKQIERDQQDRAIHRL